MTPTIREYELLSELARGGMGSVYLARRRGDGFDGPLFAVKVVHARLRDDGDARLMMLDEAHTAMRVRHTNVATVVDVGSYDTGTYLVMEYVDGCSLQQLLLTNATERPPQLIVPVLVDVLHGLHAAHTLRDPSGEPYEIVHRDVTPHNVLVGRDGVAKITDFGIALARDRYTETDFGMRKGKASYMAPEQFQGDPIDLQVDVWAAGVTAFVALTGVHPFGEGLNASTIHNIMHGELPVPSQVGLKPPACFDWVISCALSRRRAGRFSDAQAFADALQCVARRNNLLGSRAQVAAWVERSWGARLDELMRKLARGREVTPPPRRVSLPPPLPHRSAPVQPDPLPARVPAEPRPVRAPREALPACVPPAMPAEPAVRMAPPAHLRAATRAALSTPPRAVSSPQRDEATVDFTWEAPTVVRPAPSAQHTGTRPVPGKQPAQRRLER